MVRLKPDPTTEVWLQPDATTEWRTPIVRGVRLQPDHSDVDRGKQTYMRVGCYQCHGREAQGASTGPRLGPNPLPLAAFTRAVRTPRNDMPPYGAKILSDAELADVYAFAASRARPHQIPK
jgi:mono/diheme cytochrome c family protein